MLDVGVGVDRGRLAALTAREVDGQSARGVPPQANVIGSAIFLLAVGIMLVSVIVQTRRRKETPA